jgi:hypothetical protein
VKPPHIIANDRLLRAEVLEEAVHRFLQFGAVVRNIGLEMQRIQRHAELFFQTPKAWKTDRGGVYVILAVWQGENQRLSFFDAARHTNHHFQS